MNFLFGHAAMRFCEQKVNMYNQVSHKSGKTNQYGHGRFLCGGKRSWYESPRVFPKRARHQMLCSCTPFDQYSGKDIRQALRKLGVSRLPKHASMEELMDLADDADVPPQALEAALKEVRRYTRASRSSSKRRSKVGSAQQDQSRSGVFGGSSQQRRPPPMSRAEREFYGQSTVKARVGTDTQRVRSNKPRGNSYTEHTRSRGRSFFKEHPPPGPRTTSYKSPSNSSSVTHDPVDAVRKAVQEGLEPHNLSHSKASRLLGVSLNPTVVEVRSARRKLILEFHPDQNQDDPLATPALRLVMAAVEMLSP